jgi:hypothetical protein
MVSVKSLLLATAAPVRFATNTARREPAIS